MIGLLAEFVVYMINAAFLSEVNNDAFVAAGNGGLLYVTFIMIGYGIAGGSQILIARREGENNFMDCGHIFRHTILLMGIFCMLGFFVFQFLIEPFLQVTVASPAIRDDMHTFLQIRSYGIFFSIIELSFYSFFTGVARTSAVMCATIVQGGTNFLFDYMLIPGNFGFEPMGLEGAAISTLLSDFCSALVYITFVVFDRRNKKYALLKKTTVDKKLIRQILKLSYPLMAQGFLSVGAWTIFFFLIEHLGERQIAISQTIRNVYYLCLIPVLAFGTSTKTFVSTLMAKKQQASVLLNVKRIIALNFLVTLFMIHGIFIYPVTLVSIINDNPELLNDTIFTLRIVAFSMLLFAFTTPLTGLVAGSGDTRRSFLIEFYSIVIYLVATYFVTVVWPQPIQLVWCLEFLYFSLMIFFALNYIRKGKWKTIQL